MILAPGEVGGDLSEHQDPGAVRYAGARFWIIRASHGLTQDLHWRAHFDNAVNAGCAIGLYHSLEAGASPEAQADYFRSLVGFLTAIQVAAGWWVDAEEGWVTTALVDRFRSRVELPTCGLYSTLSLFNTTLREYLHFGLNWLPLLPGWFLEAGWAMPDHILEQRGQFAGVDVDVVLPAQPYPAGWAA